jgi:two-component system probable response regulator PhcQ
VVSPDLPGSVISGSILVVDDEDMIRRALVRTLKSEGHRLFTAASAEQALTLLESEPVTLVISDHRMGSMSGLELLRKISERWPDTLRVVLTGHADLQMALEAINQGGLFGFLTKPWEDSALRQMVRLGVERHALARENAQLRDTVRAQDRVLRKLEQEHPGIASVQRDSSGAVVIDED